MDIMLAQHYGIKPMQKFQQVTNYLLIAHF